MKFWSVRIKDFYSQRTDRFFTLICSSRPEAYEKIMQKYPNASKVRKQGFKKYIVLKEITEEQLNELTRKNHRCQTCGTFYSKIDILNRQKYSNQFCSLSCYKDHQRFFKDVAGNDTGYIYLFTHKPTQMKYVGQTKEPFTSRWFQHFFMDSSGTILNQFIRTSSVSEWQFEVLAEIPFRRLDEVEAHYIKELNTVEKGFNERRS